MDANAANASSNTGNVAKKGKFNEEIKEFAETAMNELLGWYGYNTTKEELKVLKRRCHSHSGSNSSGPDSPKCTEGCGWCGKSVEETNGISSGSASFCSELCFSQSRRASFKKNKTCDWCRHIRHTVSYVDFQDGASQLQFCSDKCLNQYKMHIFCRETEAHLELHPHLPGEDKSGGGLITPDLWLKNCKSPDSRTPSPVESHDNQPLISVAPPSKLMPITDTDVKRHKNKMLKRHRKRQPTSCNVYKTDAMLNTELPQDLRVRPPPPSDSSDGRVKHTETPASNRFYQSGERPAHLNAGTGLIKHPADLPPVTVLVPYPIIIPFPLPIPIPIPLFGFKAKEETANKEDTSKPDLDAGTSTIVNGSSKELDVVENVVSDDEGTRNGSNRPLRKRKRLIDSKPRILNKKKTVAV